MYYSIFKTRLGWCGVVENNGLIKRIVLPCANKRLVSQRIHKECPEAKENSSKLKKVSQLIIDYLNGEKKRLDFPIDLTGYTNFEKQVYKSLCRVPYGEVTTYGKLAKSAGNPRAARAVGNAMAKNPLPLFIPCHRVVKSDGAIGNFSALGGVALKKRLLELERSHRLHRLKSV